MLLSVQIEYGRKQDHQMDPPRHSLSSINLIAIVGMTIAVTSVSHGIINQMSMSECDDQSGLMTRKKQGLKEITAEELSPDSEVAEEDAKEIEDVECVVNVIAPLDGDPDGRLKQILDLLRQEESSLKKSCEEKMETDDQAADEIREKLLKRLYELPNEFLESPATETLLTEYQIAGPANLPSCSRTKNSISRRVIRVITKDISAPQAIAEMNKNFDEVYNRMGDISNKAGHKNEK